jgi:hypothetical protein
MGYLSRALVVTAVVVLSGCVSTPLHQIPPKMPEAGEDVTSNAANGGRVEAIAVNPLNRDNAIIAMQFGGLWKTYDAGEAWFHVDTLPELYVTDVAYGADGNTVVATVFRDTRTQNGGGGGIYVSRSNGDFWTRPATGIVPTNPWTSVPTSAYAVSRAPDERGLWYAATDFGVAISRDDGNTWSHTAFAQDAIQSVLAFPGGTVLALDATRLWRSDDRGATWRTVITDDFRQYAPLYAGIAPSAHKIGRSPLQPWAFIFKDFNPSPAHGSGSLWFYELDTGAKTLLALPQGRSRGPFVQVSRDDLYGGDFIRVWVGTGWDGYYVIRDDAGSIRALRSTPEWDDWVSFIAEAGVHADMGDLGLDADAKPAFMGSDGGIFKPRPQAHWWDIGGQHKWMSAARPGSGMNSLQISDLGGTNVHQANGTVTTTLYITTQDNNLYTTPDGGATWTVGDAGEGFGLEGPVDASAGDPAQIAFVPVGGGPMFADLGATHKRSVSNLDQNGAAVDGFQNPYFVGRQPNTTVTSWVRRRVQNTMPQTEVWFSGNSGENWHRFATVHFKFAGEVRTVGTVAWLPVFTGGTNDEIGLVPMSTSTAPGVPAPTYDDSDVVRLPGGGSLGQRFTEFDRHAIYAVHPADWHYVIAPDIVGNDVKVTRDGGQTWHTDVGLTAEVLRGGSLRMWGGKADFMQVTEIDFDPYHPRRILVGTRDAGIACTADGGRTWRTVFDSDKIHYITGFHFRPNGEVYIASYGQGLWRMDATAGCPKSYDFPWDVKRWVNEADGNIGVLARNAPPPIPRGIAARDRPKLFVTMEAPERDREGDRLAIAGRGFAPGQDLLLRCREVERLQAHVRANAKGQFALTLPLPESFPHGSFTLEARGAAGTLTAGIFDKGYSDEELEERERAGEPDRPRR